DYSEAAGGVGEERLGLETFIVCRRDHARNQPGRHAVDLQEADRADVTLRPDEELVPAAVGWGQPNDAGADVVACFEAVDVVLHVLRVVRGKPADHGGAERSARGFVPAVAQAAARDDLAVERSVRMSQQERVLDRSADTGGPVGEHQRGADLEAGGLVVRYSAEAVSGARQGRASLEPVGDIVDHSVDGGVPG